MSILHLIDGFLEIFVMMTSSIMNQGILKIFQLQDIKGQKIFIKTIFNLVLLSIASDDKF
jgi:hypothetical protein